MEKKKVKKLIVCVTIRDWGSLNHVLLFLSVPTVVGKQAARSAEWWASMKLTFLSCALANF